MAQQVGIKETGEMLTLVGKTTTVFGDITADGKVNLIELTSLLSLWPAMAPGIEGAGQIGIELSDLTPQERLQLRETFSQACKLPSLATEELFEEGTELAVLLSAFILKTRKLRQPTAL